MGSGKTHNGLRITIGVLGSAAILGGAGGAIYYLTTKQVDTGTYEVKFDCDEFGAQENGIDIFVPDGDVSFKLHEGATIRWKVNRPVAPNPGVTGQYQISPTKSFVDIGGKQMLFSDHIHYDEDTTESGYIEIPGTKLNSRDVSIVWCVKSEHLEPEVDPSSKEYLDVPSDVRFVEHQKMTIPYTFKKDWYEIDPEKSTLIVGSSRNSEPNTFLWWQEQYPSFTWIGGQVSVPADVVTSTNISVTLAAKKQDGRVDLKYNTEYFTKASYSPMPFEYGIDDITVQFQLNPSHDIQLDDEASTIKVGKKNALPLKDVATDIKPEQSFRIPNTEVDAALVEVNLVPKVKEYELLFTGEHFESAEKEVKYVKGQPVSFTIAAKGDWAKWFKFNVANSHVTKTVGGDIEDIQFEASWVVGDAVTIPAEVTNQADALSVYLGDEAIPYPIVVGSTGDQHLTVEAGQKFTYGSKLQVKYTITGEHYIVDEEKSKIRINDQDLDAAKVGKFEGNTYTLSMPWEDITKTAITVYFYSKEEDVGVEDCVKVTAKENTSLTFTKSDAMSKKPNLQYCLDIEAQEWVNFPDTAGLTIQAGSSIYLRGDNPTGWSQSATAYATLKFEGDISIAGNVMGLLDNARAQITEMPNNYCFAHLFEGSTGITSIENPGKFLPAQNLTQHCYDSMFKGCTSLSDAPALPVINLAVGCYANMFENSGIVNAPDLQATTLVANCYNHMFAGCEKLKSAQAMTKVEVLAEGCCEGMYDGSGLERAPRLAPYTVLLAKDCYKEMFKNCAGIKVSEATLTVETAETLVEHEVFCADSDKYEEGYPMSYYAGDMFTGTSGTFAGTPTYDQVDLPTNLYDHYYYNEIDQESRELNNPYDISSLGFGTDYAFGTQATDIDLNTYETYTLSFDWALRDEYTEWATNISDEEHGWCIACTDLEDSTLIYNPIKLSSISIQIYDKLSGEYTTLDSSYYELSEYPYYGIVPTQSWGLDANKVIIAKFQLYEVDTYTSGYFSIFAEPII